jgi:hypothetical protein
LNKRAIVAALFFAVLATARAFAQTTNERTVVELAGDGDDGLSSSLRELLNRVNLTLRSNDATDSGPNVLARVTLDLHEQDPTVVIVDPRNGVVAKKTIHAVSRRVALEEVALFVRFTLDAMLDQERAAQQQTPPVIEDAGPPQPSTVDAEVPDVAPPIKVIAPIQHEAPHDAPTPQKPTTIGFDLGVFGAAQAFSPEIVVLGGVGAVASMEFGRGRFRPALALFGTYYARGNTNRDGIDIHAGLVSFRLLPSFALYDGRMFSIDAALGGGMDVVNVDTHSQRFGSTTQDFRAVVPVGTAGLLGKVALGSRATLTFDLTGDADLSPRTYVIVVDNTHDPAIRPFPVRVSALLGLSIRLAGDR